MPSKEIEQYRNRRGEILNSPGGEPSRRAKMQTLALEIRVSKLSRQHEGVAQEAELAETAALSTAVTLITLLYTPG